MNSAKVDHKLKMLGKMRKREKLVFRHTTSFYRKSKLIEHQIRDKSAAILKLQRCDVSVAQNSKQPTSDAVMVTRSLTASQQDVFSSKESTSVGGNNIFSINTVYCHSIDIFICRRFQ